MKPLAESDLNHILDHTRDLWEELRGKQLFITGGTGFFGCWLLESFLWANKKYKLDVIATVLSRDPDKFMGKVPHLAKNSAIRLIKGNVINFEFPKGEYDFVIHAATEVSSQLDKNAPKSMLDTIVKGTQRTIEFACTHGTKKFLLTSSGAVYGKQPSDISHIPEDYCSPSAPLHPLSVYGEGKKIAEKVCTLDLQRPDIEVKIARCFAFVGPHLPLDKHYAIGNFIQDGLKGGPIRIIGCGKTSRSYLYAADLAIWLWKILFNGVAGRAYNVGSERIISISDLAQKVSSLFSQSQKVLIMKETDLGSASTHYAPNTQRAQIELDLREWVGLDEALKRTIRYYQG